MISTNVPSLTTAPHFEYLKSLIQLDAVKFKALFWHTDFIHANNTKQKVICIKPSPITPLCFVLMTVYVVKSQSVNCLEFKLKPVSFTHPTWCVCIDMINRGVSKASQHKAHTQKHNNNSLTQCSQRRLGQESHKNNKNSCSGSKT